MTLLTLTTDKACPCPHCGRKRKRFWSHVVPFRVSRFGQFVVVNDISPVYPAGMFVCYSGCELLKPIYGEEHAEG